MYACLAAGARAAIPVHAVAPRDLSRFLSRRGKRQAHWLKQAGFTGAAGSLHLIPAADGAVAAAVLGLGKGNDPFALAACAENLKSGIYRLDDVPDWAGGTTGAFAWALGTYKFSRYKTAKRQPPRLVLPDGVDGAEITRLIEGVFLARDLINTPANDMGPEELAEAARTLAERHDATCRLIVGEELVQANYPLIHAVGHGSVRPPLLIDIRWGAKKAPKVTLVGKGVCFDSGGLDLKPPSGMLTMKKDMGGAACVLGLAHMIMDAKLPVQLRVLIPAVENSVSGWAYRPGDVFTSRKGLSVEIGNTDAEGRLVLADALAEADSETPDLLIDLATLTGAARVATGMEVPPFFTDDEDLAAGLAEQGRRVHDPLWRLPLWRGYENTLDSTIADLNNNPDYGLAGAITAALFLNRFVEQAKSWVHFDIPGWVDRPRPGRRKGGEANAVRALYALLQARYG